MLQLRRFCFGKGGLIPSPPFLLPDPSLLSSLTAPPAPALAVQPLSVTACTITVGHWIAKQTDAAPNPAENITAVLLG